MGKKKVTLSVDTKIYTDFQKYCEENAIMLSKKIEIIMKKILEGKKGFLIFLFSFLFFYMINPVLAVQIHFEGFEGGSLSGWTLSNNNGINWVASTTNPYSGSYHAQTNQPGTTEPAAVMEKIFSTSSYQNITLRYYRRLIGLDSVDWFSAEWYDGLTWHELERINSANDGNYVLKEFNLSVDARNNSNFKIKFECTAGAVTEFCRVDDIEILGNTIDNIPPSINIIYPLNQSYNINVSRINYTISETGGNCWYSNSSGQWNSSLVSAGTNFTDVITKEGSNIFTIYCNDSAGNENSTSVTFFKDTIYPELSNYNENPINSSNYSLGRVYYFNTTIIEGYLGTVGIEFNGINYTGNYITNNSNIFIFNITGLSAGTYSYYWWVNDSSGNFNKSSVRYYAINKATPVLTFLANGGTNNLSLNYPLQVNISASATAGILGLDKEGINYLSYNNVNISLGYGSYIFRANITGNQNYSDVPYSYYNVTINKNSGNCQVLFNVTSPKTYPYKFKVYSNCNSQFTLYRDGTIISNNSEQGLAAGSYNFTIQRIDSQNYSNISEEQDFTINRATSVITLLLNGVNNNLSIVYLNNINASASTNGGSVNLYRGGVLVNSENSQNIVLGAGYYQYKANSTGNQNYSDSNNVILYANVIRKNPNSSMSISITPSQSVSYGTQTSSSSSESNSGDSDLVYKFYRDGSPIAEPNTETLNAGTYIYVFNTSGGENYSAGSVIKTLIVNKLNNPVSLLLNSLGNNISLVYGNTINASFSSSSGVIGLYRDNVDVSSENNQNRILGAGYYEYLVNSTGNINYLPNSTGKRLYANITKADSLVYLYINNSRNNFTINQGEAILINATRAIGQGNINAYNNNNLIYQGSSPYTNLTTFVNPGFYNLTAIYLSTDNYTSSYETYFLEVIDNIGPNIIISHPEIKTYGFNTSIPLNFSVYDSSSVSSCWYSIDYESNISLPNCENSSFNISDGNYILTLYSNDSLGNIASSSVDFSVSTTLAVALNKPENNKWLNRNNIEFNYTVNTALQVYSCSLFGDFNGNFMFNKTNSSPINSSEGINKFQLNLSDGSYIWNVECNAGLYTKFAFTNYTINIDTQNPSVEISLSNNSIFYRNYSISINYSVNEPNLNSCKYSLNNGINNYSVGCINGINNLDFGYKNGSYNITIYANDSSGNIGSYIIFNVSIYHDSIKPNISLTEPAGTKNSKTGIPILFSVSDNVDSNEELLCYYNVSYSATGGIVSGLERIEIFNCTSTSFNVASDSDYSLVLSVRDKSYNLAISNINFSVSSSGVINPPNPSPGGGGGGGSISKPSIKKNETLEKLDVSRLGVIVAKAGDKKTLSVSAKNTGKTFLNNCKLKISGELESMVYNKQIGGISPGENKNFIFDLNIPEGIDAKDYTSVLSIECDELSSSQDIKLVIPTGIETIRIIEIIQKDEILVINYLYNSSGNLGNEANIELWMINPDNQEVFRFNDKFFIEQEEIIERGVEVFISKDNIGIHTLYAALANDMNNPEKQTVVLGKSSTTGFTIFDEPGNKFAVYIVFVLIVFAGVGFIFFGWKRKPKGIEEKTDITR
ncbi:MAG: hypothetical protein Q8N99_08600 [Nanoarchaeota archaeon]|nr:hypothetical protein [Nanoarchaeota archaeon]